MKLWDKIVNMDMGWQFVLSCLVMSVLAVGLAAAMDKPDPKPTGKAKRCVCVPGSCRCCKGCTRTGWPLDDREIVKGIREKKAKYKKPTPQWF